MEAEGMTVWMKLARLFCAGSGIDWPLRCDSNVACLACTSPYFGSAKGFGPAGELAEVGDRADRGSGMSGKRLGASGRDSVS